MRATPAHAASPPRQEPVASPIGTVSTDARVRPIARAVV